MADDIKVVVKVVGQQDIVKTTKSLKAMENGVKSLSKDLDAGRISGKQFNTGLKELRRNVDGSFPSWQKAKSSVDAYAKSVLQASNAAKQAKIDQEVAKVSASYDRLKASIDPVFAAQQRMKKAHAEIRAALKAEVITRDEAAASLRQYRTALKNGQVAGQALNKGMNRTGVLAQQAGYQFGDFAVQIQSGTNIMVAAGQQATQLVGTFAMLAKTTRGIMAFSALGVIIPVLTGIGAALLRTASASDTAAKATEDLEGRIKSITESLRDYARAKEAAGLGVSVEAMDLQDSIDLAETELAEAKSRLETMASFAFGPQGVSGQTPVFAIDISAAWRYLTEGTTDYQAAVEEVEAAQQKLADLQAREADERQKEITEEIARRQAVVGLIQQEAAFQASLFGKTSAEQARANELRAFQNQLIEDGIRPLSYQYLEAMKYYNQMVQNRDATESQAQALEDAAKAQELLSTSSLGYETQLLVVNAQIQALQDGKNAEVAAFLEGERTKVTAIYETARALHVQTGNVVALAEASLIFIEAMSNLDKLAAARDKLTELKGGVSGGASNVVNINEIIEARKEQVAQERVLLGLSGQQQAAQKIYYDLLKQNERADIKLTQTELKGAAQAIAAQEEQNRVIAENRKQQEDLADFVANSMGDALMSIVDGTMTVKDAFKSMASDIIKELYRVLVVERMVQSIKGFLSPTPVPNANGNAFSNGSIQAYANGGVVGGPTYFPMSGGKTGLMGEAGPEAIMPLKRGANGKLGVQMEGGGGNTTVVQNFNFSANGDDSVKKIIAQAAPQIANMTKKSIMDDRRRGGQMKATFG